MKLPVASCQLPVKAPMHCSYEDLVVWQKAMRLVTVVYEATEAFPHKELYGLTQQIRRAAVSIPSNIAEGQGRRTVKEFCHFLRTARGSLLELETQIRIACNLNYLDEARLGTLLARTHEVGRVLNGLIAAVAESRARKVGSA
ncbi:MAG: four helix bundle protein [Terriglobales bacterium]